MNDYKTISKIAKKNLWEKIDHQEDIFMISFKKQYSRINVYYSKMTVATCIDHPKKGKTQMFRKKVDLELLNEIFKNPRVHTDKGYRKKC